MGANRRGAAVSAAAGLLGLVIAGCGAGQDASTSLNLPSVPGVNASAADNSVLVRNAVVAFSAEPYPAGGAAPVDMFLFNETFDTIRLVEATSSDEDGDGAASVSFENPTEIPAAGRVQVTLQATGLRQRLGGADSLPLTLVFDNGAEIFMRVPMAPPMDPAPREPMDLSDH